ncbi:NAD(P)H-binding protein [Mammaliicoccus sciuri]|uniref:NAD(P)H-binding protein n=1 Tax=Mammaliicoccus sciuri TaxID=1296 RepID=UPI003CF4ED81
MARILLTGASGYIGSNLMKKLKVENEIIAISRNIENKVDEKNVTWKKADIFSLIDVENVMKDIDIAIYLVHSMMPNSKLTQAKFEDMDFLLADNFGRAAKKEGVKHIIYMSGLIPKEDNLSRHLESRLECEKVLGSYGVPVSTLRAGLIVGSNGSSYPILKKLTQRLPLLLLPKWANNITHPIYIDDVINSITKVVSRRPKLNESIDVGGPDELTYKDLFKQTASVLNKKMPMFNLPIIPLILSKYWIRLISGEKKEIVYPLMDSLVHNMRMDNKNYIEGISDGKTTFKESVKLALKNESSSKKKKNKSKTIKNVKSVQRFRIPTHMTIEDIANDYMEWLNNLNNKLISTKYINGRYMISLFPIKNPILILEKSDSRSDVNRQLLYITGGGFSKNKNKGRARMEFRRVLNKNECIVAIHEYEPTLPWIIYKLTQARIHLYVMTLYNMHLKSIEYKVNKLNLDKI